MKLFPFVQGKEGGGKEILPLSLFPWKKMPGSQSSRGKERGRRKKGRGGEILFKDMKSTHC